MCLRSGERVGSVSIHAVASCESFLYLNRLSGEVRLSLSRSCWLIGLLRGRGISYALVGLCTLLRGGEYT